MQTSQPPATHNNLPHPLCRSISSPSSNPYERKIIVCITLISVFEFLSAQPTAQTALPHCAQFWHTPK